MKHPNVNNPPREARGVRESASRSVKQKTLFEYTPSDGGVVVEVIRIAPAYNRGNLQAFADVKVGTPLGTFIFRRCRVIRQPGQRAYATLPQEEIPTRDGGRAYVTLVTAPAPISEAIQQAILEAWEVRANG